MRAYQDMVFSTATRLVGSDAQAEDIAQEVFVRAYAHFDELRGSRTSGGWLKTVTTNLSINHLQRHRRRWRLFSEMEPLHEEEGAPPAFEATDSQQGLPANLDTEQQRALIEAALQRLPADQRAALVLYHFEDFSYQEIAKQLRASLGKVKTDIHRARAALVPLLQTSGIDRSSLED
ncbi:MAG: RNA polymerase sigma factor [Steroidobacteraceae bacterium]